MEPSKPGFESRLIPLMREGVDIVKLILFKEMKALLDESPEPGGGSENALLAGALINELFGEQPLAGPLADFRRRHAGRIDLLLRQAAVPEKLWIPLTDALRMSVLCDFQEKGIDNRAVLEQASWRGLLLADRALPLPNSFMDLVRRLGLAYGLLKPLEEEGQDREAAKGDAAV